DKTILIASHGCACRGILHNVYEDKTDFWHGKVPPNCAVNIVSAEDGKAVLEAEDKIYYDPAEVCGFPHGKESVPDRKSRTDQMRKENSKTEVKDWNSGRFALCIPVFLCYNF
ncbi:MAG: hypothetical protein V8S58_03915, partial [Lachnospiraceae bacterium]